MTATETKMVLENKHLGNGDYFLIIASSSPPLLLTEHTANGLVEVLLCVHVIVITLNLEISCCHLADYIKELY